MVNTIDPQRTRVFCSLRQQCTWDGRTHYEIINSPIPPLLPRVEALEVAVQNLRHADLRHRYHWTEAGDLGCTASHLHALKERHEHNEMPERDNG